VNEITPSMVVKALHTTTGVQSWVHLRGEMNDLWLSEKSRYILRIAPDDEFSLVRPEVTVYAARLLDSFDVPAVRLVEDIDQPIRVGGRYATLWHWLEDEGPVMAGQLGGTLRILHALPTSGTSLPTRDLRPVIRSRLDALTTEEPWRNYYWMLLDDRLRDAGPVFDNLESIVVHGDMRASNVIGNGGRAVLLDLDSVSEAPRLFDVWRLILDHRNGRLDAALYSDFCVSLGDDPDSGGGLNPLFKFCKLVSLHCSRCGGSDMVITDGIRCARVMSTGGRRRRPCPSYQGGSNRGSDQLVAQWWI